MPESLSPTEFAARVRDLLNYDPTTGEGGVTMSRLLQHPQPFSDGDRVLLDGAPGTIIGAGEHPDSDRHGVIYVKVASGVVHWVATPTHRLVREIAPHLPPAPPSFSWVDATGVLVSRHAHLLDAGLAHRRHCRSDIRCLDQPGNDVSDLAIHISVGWR